MKHKEIFSALILGSLLLLSGCGASDMPKMKEADITPDVETEERGEDTVITGEMLADSDSSAENEEFLNEEEWVWQNVNKSENAIHVTADQLQGNILGYSLLRYSPNPENQMYYERDMAYLVEEEFVGKGIYISDYMCETDSILRNMRYGSWRRQTGKRWIHSGRPTRGHMTGTIRCFRYSEVAAISFRITFLKTRKRQMEKFVR